jgi:hypothetical protein
MPLDVVTTALAQAAIEVPPSKKATVPVGLPAVEETVAV